jgi:pseudouridine synthase
MISSYTSTVAAIFSWDAIKQHVLLLLLLLSMASFSVKGFSVQRNNHKHEFGPPKAEKTVVIAYHKPPNVITSHSDRNALAAVSRRKSDSGPRRTCYDDIQSMDGCTEKQQHSGSSWEQVTGIQSKLHAIGRLDCDTTGLLLLTNDGGLVHHVTNPRSKAYSDCDNDVITKTYEAVIMGCHENNCEYFQRLRTEGIDIGEKYGGHTKPVEHLQVLDYPTAKSTQVSITISEGKNRQIRRMFHAIGSGVMQLRRVRIGKKLTLQGVEQEGQWRILKDTEVKDCLGWQVRPIMEGGRKKKGLTQQTRKPSGRDYGEYPGASKRRGEPNQKPRRKRLKTNQKPRSK